MTRLSSEGEKYEQARASKSKQEQARASKSKQERFLRIVLLLGIQLFSSSVVSAYVSPLPSSDESGLVEDSLSVETPAPGSFAPWDTAELFPYNGQQDRVILRWATNETVEGLAIKEVRIFLNCQLIVTAVPPGGQTYFTSPLNYFEHFNMRGFVNAEQTFRFESVVDIGGSQEVRVGGEVEVNLAPPAAIISTPLSALKGLNIPNDEFFASQWALHNAGTQRGSKFNDDLDLPQAWSIETGNSNVVVAICDGAFNWYHRDLRNVWIPGFDFSGFTNAYATTIQWYPTLSERLGAISSYADLGGFDPFACFRFLSTCTSPDSTWQPQLYQSPFLDAVDPYTPKTYRFDDDHGTRVASIIGAERNNLWGGAGIAGGSGAADGVRLLPISMGGWSIQGHPGVAIHQLTSEVFFFEGAQPADSKIILTPTFFTPIVWYAFEAASSSLEYATYLRSELGVNIRVMTFSIPGNCGTTAVGECPDSVARWNNAVERAWEAGIFIVSAAGNNYCEENNTSTSVMDMALAPYVFSVTELTWEDILADGSSCGPTTPEGSPINFEKSASMPGTSVTMAAPGSGILVATTDDQRDPVIQSGASPVPGQPSISDAYNSNHTGTSFAAPQVAGVAALLFSYAERPGAVIAAEYQPFGPEQAWKVLLRSASTVGYDVRRHGAGRVNAYRALLELRGQPNLPGDVDGDGQVTEQDVAKLKAWLSDPSGMGVVECVMDVNADGSVDKYDLGQLRSFVRYGYPDLLIPEDCF